MNYMVYEFIVQDGRSFGDFRKPESTHLLDEILPGKTECQLPNSKYY